MMTRAFPSVMVVVAITAWTAALNAQADAPPVAAAAVATQATQAVRDQAALEREFQATMSGAVLVGRFSDAARPDAPPKEDRYTIQRVSKITDDAGAGAGDGAGDRWLFLCRIPFGTKDLAVPLTIPVKWAGDTPVISVTDMTIPGMGTYSARVMIYGDQYAGTWRGGTHGGHLWGRIERAGTAQPAATTTRPRAAKPVP
jgi:hypothetical protein